MAEGEGGGVGLAVRADLAVEVLDVPLDRPLAAAEERGHLAVALAGGDQAQHLRLARRQAAGVADVNGRRGVDAAQTVLFATDYPHWDFDNPQAALKHVPAGLRERIFVSNALDLYGDRLLAANR